MAQELGGTIASTEQLEEFASLPPDQRVARLDAAARGVLAETALRGRQRYEWRLLLPLLHALVDVLLAEYTPPEEEGPPRPPPPGFEAAESLGARLHSLLDGFEAAPFTLQRLCEVLLEPRKQYARLDKVTVAVEKLLMVTSTRQPDPPASLPPPPQLSELRGVNDNPPSPYLDGRPPQVLDPQQHQALLQQQGRLGGMANGLGDPSLRGTDSDGSAAAAAADTMQLDVAPMTAAAAEAAVAAQAAAAAAVAPAPPPITAAEAEVAAEFVHSALADEEGSPPGSGAGSSPPAAGGRAPPEQQAQAGAAEPSPVGEWPGQGAIASAAAAAAAAAAEPAADGDAAMAAADGPQQAGAAQAGATAGQPAGEGPSGVTAMDASPAKQQQQQRPGEELQ